MLKGQHWCTYYIYLLSCMQTKQNVMNLTFFISRTYTFSDEHYFMSTCSNCLNSFKFTSLALQFPDHQKYEAAELFLWQR